METAFFLVIALEFERVIRRRRHHLYVKILNPIDDSKTYINQNEAYRLVYYGHASYVGEGQREIRYLADAERVRIQSDMNEKYELIGYDRAISVGRGGPTTGEWHPGVTSANKTMPGAPQERAQQYDMTLEYIADLNRKRKRK